jgi:ABC-type transport system substrate-binding protein
VFTLPAVGWTSRFQFTIRQGVRFSHGDPLTAADVVYSINRVVAKSSKYPYASSMGTLWCRPLTHPLPASLWSKAAPVAGAACL